MDLPVHQEMPDVLLIHEWVFAGLLFDQVDIIIVLLIRNDTGKKTDTNDRLLDRK